MGSACLSLSDNFTGHGVVGRVEFGEQMSIELRNEFGAGSEKDSRQAVQLPGPLREDANTPHLNPLPQGRGGAIRRCTSSSVFARATARRAGRKKCAILRNEPTVLRGYLLRNKHCIRNLRLKFVKRFGGFVSENEPKSSPFSAAFRPEWVRFGGNWRVFDWMRTQKV